MQIAVQDDLVFELQGSGPLLPWLGPAFRGVLALACKDTMCHLTTPEREKQGPYCRGCPQQPGCPYGETFEAEPRGAERRFAGQGDATRPLVLAPYFPLPSNAGSLLRVPVRLTLVGETATRHAPHILEAMTLGPGNARLGHGQVCGRLLVGQAGISSSEVWPADLPPTPDAMPGTVPRLGVGLTSPLFLEREVSVEKQPGGRTSSKTRARRRPIGRPQFADLFRAALRTLGQLFRLYDQPLPADFAALKHAAQEVQLVEHCYESFQQRKWTTRGEQHYLLQGCSGGGVYADVPLALLPWMIWGGRLHVGQHRVAGAGGWRLVLD